MIIIIEELEQKVNSNTYKHTHCISCKEQFKFMYCTPINCKKCNTRTGFMGDLLTNGQIRLNYYREGKSDD